MNMLNNNIVIPQISFVNCLIFLLCICIRQINIYRHERTIFLNDFTHTIFITKLQAFIIQKQRNLCTNCCSVPILHIIFCTTITCPVYCCCTFFKRKSINMHFICYHKCRIESQTEMTDHLVIRCFIFILLQKFCCTRKCDLCNIFLYFISSHTNTIIDKFQSLCFRIYNDLHCRFIIIRESIFSHHFKFL